MNANDKISIFIKLYFPAAVKAWRQTIVRNEEDKIIKQVPILSVLAQGGLESDWGENAPGSAFHGIKADSKWKGKKQLKRTFEIFGDNNRKLHVFPEVISITAFKDGNKTKYKWVVKDWFRAYDSAEEGFTDYCRFLEDNPRYAAAFTVTEPKAFSVSVAAAGYATGLGYAKLVKDCIDSVANRLPLLGLQIPHDANPLRTAP